jgi:hypothetical protein
MSECLTQNPRFKLKAVFQYANKDNWKNVMFNTEFIVSAIKNRTEIKIKMDITLILMSFFYSLCFAYFV